MNSPATPTATAARANTGTISRWPPLLLHLAARALDAFASARRGADDSREGSGSEGGVSEDGGGEGSEAGTKGGLLDPSTKDLTSGNVNVPGSKTATKLSPVTKGHGAEKKGAGEEGGTVKTSLFRK